MALRDNDLDAVCLHHNQSDISRSPQPRGLKINACSTHALVWLNTAVIYMDASASDPYITISSGIPVSVFISCSPAMRNLIAFSTLHWANAPSYKILKSVLKLLTLMTRKTNFWDWCVIITVVLKQKCFIKILFKTAWLFPLHCGYISHLKYQRTNLFMQPLQPSFLSYFPSALYYFWYENINMVPKSTIAGSTLVKIQVHCFSIFFLFPFCWNKKGHRNLNSLPSMDIGTWMISSVSRFLNVNNKCLT